MFEGVTPHCIKQHCMAQRSMVKRSMMDQTLFVYVLTICVLAGCHSRVGETPAPQPCTEAWYEYVEARVSTGDGRGHGPDPGSDEWKAVVEFKLGIRGDKTTPPRNTQQWCDYIDGMIGGRVFG